MTQLLRDKVVVRMGNEEVYIHRHALDSLGSQMVELRGQAIDVAGFRRLTGVSRKYAIPNTWIERELLARLGTSV
jgi:Elongation factor SelB, winged helix